MSTKLIKLTDGSLVEVNSSEKDIQQISSNLASKVETSIDGIKPVLLKAISPIVSTWKELNKEMIIEKAEIELGLSFEGEGNIYITKVSASANYKIKLTLVPPKT